MNTVLFVKATIGFSEIFFSSYSCSLRVSVCMCVCVSMFVCVCVYVCVCVCMITQKGFDLGTQNWNTL